MIRRTSFATLARDTLRLAVPLYAVSVLLAAVPVIVGMIGLLAVASDRPWRAELLGPNWLNLFIELVGESVYRGGSASLGTMVVAGSVLVPLAMLGQVVGYSYLAGGIVQQFTAAPDDRRAFRQACRRWFWQMFRLTVLGSALVLAVGSMVPYVSDVAGPALSGIIQVLVLALALGWVELARVVMVRDGLPTIGLALRRAAPAFLRPLALGVWVVVALPTGGLLLAASVPPALADPYAIDGFVLALVYGQVVAFLMAWTKVIRLAVAARLAKSVLTPVHVPAATRPGPSS